MSNQDHADAAFEAGRDQLEALDLAWSNDTRDEIIGIFRVGIAEAVRKLAKIHAEEGGDAEWLSDVADRIERGEAE